jgi:hypothetical protein
MKSNEQPVWRLTVHIGGIRKLSKNERIRNTRTYNNIRKSSVETVLESIDKEGFDVKKHHIRLMPI